MKKKLRVIHIITGLGIGGAEAMLYKLLTAQDKNNFESIVISLSDRGTYADRLKKEGIKVYTLDMHLGKPTFGAFMRLRNLIIKLKPDAMQGWMYHGNLAASLVNTTLWQQDIPVLWNIRHSLYKLSNEKKMTIATIVLGRLFSHRTKKIIYNSYTGAEQHEAKVGYSKKKSIIISNGFDCNLYKPNNHNYHQFRKGLDLNNEVQLVGMIARFHIMKDHGNFLTAAKKVVESFPNTHFVLVGTHVDNDNNFLVDLIQELRIKNNCHLLGERSDIPYIMSACDIIVTSSSHGEGFPNVIGEAMACGVPCVATDIGDSSRVVDDFGHIVPPKDSIALSKGIVDMLSMTKKVKKKLGEQARNHIIGNFTIDAIEQQYGDLYIQVCS